MTNYGIMNAEGRIIATFTSRANAIRLAGTTILRGSPVAFVFGEWVAL